MSKFLFPIVLLFFICYIIWKVFSVYNENKKLNISFNHLIEKNKTRSDTFSSTKEIGDLKLDYINELFKFQGQIQLFEFNELLNFDILLNNNPINLTQEKIKSDFDMTNFLIDSDKITTLDLIFYVSGLNKGRYSYQFLYEPLTSESKEYNELISKLNRTVLELHQIIEEN